MTRYVKFIGTRFADTLGVAAGTLSQKLLGKDGSDTLLGGLANDKIKGNDGNDWIVGGGGNDDIDGGKGLDTAVYQGRFSEYELTFKANLDGKVKDLVAGRDGTDTLKKVEFLKFSDGIYDIASDTFQVFNHAPTLATPPAITYTDTAAHDTFAAVTAMLLAADPNGDTLLYSLAGGVSDNSFAGYDVSKSTGYGSMYLNSTTGAYTFVPVSAAIEALKITSGIDFTFTVSDGELSDSKTLTVAMNGVNDSATIGAAAAGSVAEDGALTAGGTLTVVDPDSGDAQFQPQASLAKTYGTFTFDATTGAWTYTLANGSSLVQALAGDAMVHDTLTVTSTDGTASRAIDVTIAGDNDDPLLQAAVGAGQEMAEDHITLTATMAFSDVDLTDTHTVTVAALGGGIGYIGNVTSIIVTDSTNGAAGSVGLTYHLTQQQFLDAGGVFPDHQDYRVTIDDGHGGTSSQDISISLGDILQGDGGGPTTQPPVFTTISPPSPFIAGVNQGQLVDNPFVLHPSVGPADPYLHAQGTLFFTDPDGGSHHASLDLAHAFVAGHSVVDANHVLHNLLPGVAVDPSALVWQFFLQEPNQVFWSVTLPESAIRSMSGGELETIVVPITVSEDGTGSSTTKIRIDLVGTDESPSLLPPDTILTANSDISPYLVPPDLATHQQSQYFDITEDPLITGSTSHHHTLSGTITFVDPDRLDQPAVSMVLTDPGVPAGQPQIEALQGGFHYTVEPYGNYGMIHWTYDVPDNALDFLAQGDANLPYGGVVTVGARFDVGGIAGGSSSIVNVILHGANDPVLIAGTPMAHADVTLGGGTIGSFTFSDADFFPDKHIIDIHPRDLDSHGFMQITNGSETGSGGSSTVEWSYSTNFATGTLAGGQHDIFDFVVRDDFGSVATYTVDILLHDLLLH